MEFTRAVRALAPFKRVILLNHGEEFNVGDIENMIDYNDSVFEDAELQLVTSLRATHDQVIPTQRAHLINIIDQICQVSHFNKTPYQFMPELAIVRAIDDAVSLIYGYLASTNRDATRIAQNTFTVLLIFMFKRYAVGQGMCNKATTTKSLHRTIWNTVFHPQNLLSIRLLNMTLFTLDKFQFGSRLYFSSEAQMTELYGIKLSNIIMMFEECQYILYKKHSDEGNERRRKKSFVPDVTLVEAVPPAPPLMGAMNKAIIEYKLKDIVDFPAEDTQHKLILRQVLLSAQLAEVIKANITPNQCYHLRIDEVKRTLDDFFFKFAIKRYDATENPDLTMGSAWYLMNLVDLEMNDALQFEFYCSLIIKHSVLIRV